MGVITRQDRVLTGEGDLTARVGRIQTHAGHQRREVGMDVGVVADLVQRELLSHAQSLS